MTDTPSDVVTRMFAALDQGDLEAMLATFTEDAMGLDEISRDWFVGLDGFRAHAEGALTACTEIRSCVEAVHTRDWGDTAVVACRVEQDYELEGKPTHVSAPTTAVLRRTRGAWKIGHFHMVPLPDAP